MLKWSKIIKMARITKRIISHKSQKNNKKTRKNNKKQTGSGKRKNKLTKFSGEKVSLKKLRCSPKDKKEINEFSCYTDESLYKLRDLWNARHPDAKIETNDTKEIHSKLAHYLSDVCNKESCWLKQSSQFGKSLMSSDIADSFAPESPKEWKKNPNEWLTSLDIINVMKQYEKAYKCFDFIGPSPIDFDAHMLYNECVWEELCHFDLKTLLSKGKNKIGIIFNTDPHYKNGSHWISLFIHVKKGYIFYFDSNGNEVPKEIKVLVDRVLTQAKALNIPLAFDQNYPMEHQYSNTECGMYSLYFIIQLLRETHNIDFFKNHRIKDKDMETLRGEYFNISK